MSEFTKAVIAYRPFMVRIAMTMLHNEMDSDDAVQDTLFRCWQHLDSLRDAQKMRPWLLRCLTNRCLDMRRRAGRERLLCDALERSSELYTECDPLAFLEMRETLAAIPCEARACLSLHYREGYTIAEIAEFMNLPCSTVKSRLYRERRRVLGQR